MFYNRKMKKDFQKFINHTKFSLFSIIFLQFNYLLLPQLVLLYNVENYVMGYCARFMIFHCIFKGFLFKEKPIF